MKRLFACAWQNFRRLYYHSTSDGDGVFMRDATYLAPNAIDNDEIVGVLRIRNVHAIMMHFVTE